MTGAAIKFVTESGRLAVVGECDLSTAGAIERWIGSLDLERCEIDLSGVTFFDAAALRTLLNARRRNPRLRVVQPSRAVLRVIEITGTGPYLLTDEEEE